MEGAAVAQACALNDIPFLIVRAVSDKADGSGKVNFEEFAAKSATNASALVKRIIALL